MTAALAQQVAPLPLEVDHSAEGFHQLETHLAEAKTKFDEAQKQLADRKEELIAMVREFGGPHREKSKILHGIVWEIMATFGQHTAQDAAAIERFRLALTKAKKTRVLKKLFTKDVRWTMNAGAAQIAAAEKLSPKLMALLLQCSDTQDKKPTLDVRPKKKAS